MPGGWRRLTTLGSTNATPTVNVPRPVSTVLFSIHSGPYFRYIQLLYSCTVLPLYSCTIARPVVLFRYIEVLYSVQLYRQLYSCAVVGTFVLLYSCTYSCSYSCKVIQLYCYIVVQLYRCTVAQLNSCRVISCTAVLQLYNCKYSCTLYSCTAQFYSCTSVYSQIL